MTHRVVDLQFEHGGKTLLEFGRMHPLLGEEWVRNLTKQMLMGLDVSSTLLDSLLDLTSGLALGQPWNVTRRLQAREHRR